VHGGAMLGGVDWLAGEQRRDALLHPARAREVDQQLDRAPREPLAAEIV
jgi:hypothetical protein